MTNETQLMKQQSQKKYLKGRKSLNASKQVLVKILL